MRILLLLLIVLSWQSCRTPAEIQRTYENSISFEYEDLLTGNFGSISTDLVNEARIYTQTGLENGMFRQIMSVNYRIDTGQYNVSEFSIRGISFGFTGIIDSVETTVIGTNDWEQPIYSFNSPERYLETIFSTGALDDSTVGFNLDLNAYGFVTSGPGGGLPNPSGEHDFAVEHAEIVTDMNGQQLLYVEGTFSGRTISAGYPTVPLDFGGDVLRIFNGRFTAKWEVE